MKVIASLLIVVLLAACGVEGDPIRPTANLGVSLGSSGVRTTTSVGLSKGNVSVGVGL